MDDDKMRRRNDPIPTKPLSPEDDAFEKSMFDEEKPSIFHVTTKYKWVLALSILMLAAEGLLIYATVMGAIAAEIWQTAIWGVGVLLALYAIIKKSMAATLFNLVLLVGISLIPAWGTAYEFFRPVIELFTGAASTP